jgi:hypothetical protein
MLLIIELQMTRGFVCFGNMFPSPDTKYYSVCAIVCMLIFMYLFILAFLSLFHTHIVGH